MPTDRDTPGDTPSAAAEEPRDEIFEAIERLMRTFEFPPALLHPEANERATALLRAHLTRKEWKQLNERGYVEVASPSVPGRVYRIPRSRGMVTLYQNSVPVVRLCIGPADVLPRDDVVLMHLITIRGNEQEYLETANPFPARAKVDVRD